MWKIGDRAIIDCPSCNNHGKVVTIRAVGVTVSTFVDGTFTGAEVDLESAALGYDYCVFEYHELRHLPDDKHKRFHKALISSKWSDCEYNPMVEIEQ